MIFQLICVLACFSLDLSCMGLCTSCTWHNILFYWFIFEYFCFCIFHFCIFFHPNRKKWYLRLIFIFWLLVILNIFPFAYFLYNFFDQFYTEVLTFLNWSEGRFYEVRLPALSLCFWDIPFLVCHMSEFSIEIFAFCLFACFTLILACLLI